VATAETLSWAYLALNVTGFFFISQKVTKSLFSAANLMMGASTLLLGHWATAALCLTTASRIFVSIYADRIGTQRRLALCLGFCVVHILMMIVVWSSAADYLLLFLGVFTTLLFFYASNLYLRLGLVLSCTIWAINGLMIQNIQLVLGQLPGIVMSGVLAWRIFSTRKSTVPAEN
tara:strand:+ start:965 stop:1489 length:525 start_codon:yes stop_codon:yes gene_type:complete